MKNMDRSRRAELFKSSRGRAAELVSDVADNSSAGALGSAAVASPADSEPVVANASVVSFPGNVGSQDAADQSDGPDVAGSTAGIAVEPAVLKRRGRPPGSVNRPKSDGQDGRSAASGGVGLFHRRLG